MWYVWQRNYMAVSEKPENGDLNIGLHATMKPDELNYSNFPSDIHSATWISLGTDMQPLFLGDNNIHQCWWYRQEGWLGHGRTCHHQLCPPKLQLPATKCRLYHFAPRQCPRSVVDSRPIWVILCRAAKVHSVGQQLLFHAGPSGESVSFD